MSKYINAEDLKKSFRDDLEKMYPLMDSESTRKLAIDVINGVCKDIDEFPAAEVVPRQNIEAAIAEIEEAKFKGFTDDNCKNHMPDHQSYFNAALIYAVKTINKHTKI